MHEFALKAEDIADPVYREKMFTVPDIIADWTSPYLDLAGARILDFGCGEGTAALAFVLRKQAARVVGIDIVPDPDLCAPYARQHLGLDRLPDALHLQRVAQGELHNETDTFDLAYSWSVVEHVREDLLDPTFVKLFSSIRPGGLLFTQISPLYYSAGGSHLLHKIPEPWGHLSHQLSEYMDRLRRACADEAEYRALAEMFETLNRITVPRLREAIERAGFEILREHCPLDEDPIPRDLARLYNETTLRQFQIVILARRPDPCAAAAIDLPGETLELSLPRFVGAQPRPENALRLRAGTWRFGIDAMDIPALRAHAAKDIRPQWSAEVFPGFESFRVIELGPQDGLITAGLEAFGVGSIVAIEANVDAFLHCLILKNALGLRATYLLGDFLAYLNAPDTEADLIYASGVLYHLEDPVAFLRRCAAVAPHVYLWTFFYDEDAVRAHEYESGQFVARSGHSAMDQNFSYFKREYDDGIRGQATFSGGIKRFANWMTLEDIERALIAAGYTIMRRVPDSYSGMPAMNLWASIL